MKNTANIASDTPSPSPPRLQTLKEVLGTMRAVTDLSTLSMGLWGMKSTDRLNIYQMSSWLSVRPSKLLFLQSLLCKLIPRNDETIHAWV
eukprot:6492535-Amphidinium_carterae.1